MSRRVVAVAMLVALCLFAFSAGQVTHGAIFCAAAIHLWGNA
jgi:hypothetical protein